MEKKKECHNSPTNYLPPLYPDIVNDCTIMIRVHGFSSCSEWNIGEHSKYDCNDKMFRKHFATVLWFDGNSRENDTYVSIGILSQRLSFSELNFNSIELRCLSSVIDVSGNKRFLQTLAYISDSDKAKWKSIVSFDKYIKRSTLLNKSSELLPDDTLTLCLDINYEIHCQYRTSAGLKDFENLGYCVNEEDELCIHMDLPHGQYLRKLSNVFQRMMVTPMKESKTRLFRFPKEELYYIQLLYHINKGDDFVFKTIGEISRFYEFADKYNMQSIIQMCRYLMMSILLTMNSIGVLNYISKDIHIISELSKRFIMDESLKEILTMYSGIKRKREDGKYELEASSISKMGTEWTCDYKGNYFLFSKIKNEDMQMDFNK